MSIGLLTLYLRIPGCSSLKEKRSRIKPLLARLHREFNVSVSEVDQQDSWKETVLACVLVTSEAAQTQRSLQSVSHWVEKRWPDVEIVDDRIELIA